MVIAAAGFLATGFTKLISSLTGSGNVTVGNVVYASAGQNVVLLLGALVAAACGIIAYRQMDDRKGVSLRADLIAAIRGEPLAPELGRGRRGPLAERGLPARARRLFIALEGGEGAGKTTQARMLAIWLREQGFDVVTTREPGATKVGMRLRALLLDTAHAGMAPRAEALMYAADRAEHVASVISPALARGAVVITDRCTPILSLAYQGAGRGLHSEEVAWLSHWATGGLMPGPDDPARPAAAGRPGAAGQLGGPPRGRAVGVPRAGPCRVPRPGPERARPLPRARRDPPPGRADRGHRGAAA